ncbi:hypothetical protein SLA2020_278740 [Shorea laevis]
MTQILRVLPSTTGLAAEVWTSALVVVVVVVVVAAEGFASSAPHNRKRACSRWGLLYCRRIAAPVGLLVCSLGPRRLIVERLRLSPCVWALVGAPPWDQRPPPAPHDSALGAARC